MDWRDAAYGYVILVVNDCVDTVKFKFIDFEFPPSEVDDTRASAEYRLSGRAGPRTRRSQR